MVPLERPVVSSYRPTIVTFSFPLSLLRFSEIFPLLCSSTPLFHTPPLVSPNHVWIVGRVWIVAAVIIQQQQSRHGRQSGLAAVSALAAANTDTAVGGRVWIVAAVVIQQQQSRHGRHSV